MAPSWLSRKGSDHAFPSLFLAGLRRPERNGLCSRCTKYDFQTIFASSEEYPPIKWTERVPLAHIQKHKSCPFCRLIFETISTAAASAKPERSLNSFTDDQGRVWLEQERNEFWCDTRKGVKHYVSRVSVQDCANRRYLIHSIPSPGFDDPNKSFDCYLRGRKLGGKVSIALLESWLQICADFHGRSCSSAIDGSEKKSQLIGKDFRLIDIENECIVPAPDSDFKYFTLSYVWGGSTVPQLKLQRSTRQRLVEPGGLSNNYMDIPTTIRDAMTLCRLLGQRYLWIDALCIFQDNPEDQILQISRMQKIYEYSDLTIVCAYGGDTWAGLPGVSTRIHQQHIEVVQGLYLGNKLPDLNESILTSIWATRAWTMQERYFSKRLLFFTKHQIYFQCQEKTWSEDKIIEVQPYVDIKNGEFRRQEHQGNFEHFFRPRKDLVASKENLLATYTVESVNLLHQGISIYTARNMTNPNDILNAFSGILASFSYSMGSAIFWGLPIRFFENELLFRSIAKVRRRRRLGFPSWSWVGWQSEDISQSPIEHIPWSMSFKTVTRFYRWQDNEYVRIKSDINYKGISDQHLSSPIDHRTPPKLPTALTNHEKSMILVFQTTSVYLEMSCPSRTGCQARPPGGSRSAEPIARVNSTIIESDLHLGKMEFILLGTYNVNSYLAGSDSDDGAECLIMAIKTDQRGISERIDMCHVSSMGRYTVPWRTWLACKPRLRTVFLL